MMNALAPELNIQCDRHHTGSACEWPVCVHGYVDPLRRVCSCFNYFAPPFCEFCLPGFWGEACDRKILLSLGDPRLPAFFAHVIVYSIVVIFMLSAYYAWNS
ncbi:unnamed protein product [Angiostrongylus costaricensis]|uniref:EGF-like domain-containing protein n=1 Tax=Angiostrongylus costaricensis TaxID=334426 RepID=A0A0R3PJ05_ANGCS|nr:unnamed protein product [Angiostrongylus costaricensis]